MEQITINFDDKNYYIIIPRDNKYQLELSSNRVRIKIGDEDKSCKLVNSENMRTERDMTDFVRNE